ncbi:MAG: hypothetical protein ACR2HF_08825, partial [Methylococcaceae bacterium]
MDRYSNWSIYLDNAVFSGKNENYAEIQASTDKWNDLINDSPKYFNYTSSYITEYSAPVSTTTITSTPATTTSDFTQNKTLYADGSQITDADGLGSFSYQWQRSLDGTRWAVISGATQFSYKLSSADIGQVVRVVLSYTDGSGHQETVYSPSSLQIASNNTPPTGTPSITGSPQQNQTLTANTSTLSDPDGMGALSYQWSANGVSITGATGSTYTPTQNEVGKTIAVKVNYTDALGTAETVTSSTVGPVVNVNDAPGGSLTISGTLATGQTLTVLNNLSDADGLGTFSYQWLAGGVPISGATGSSYLLSRAEAGKNLSVVARYTDLQGSAETVTSTVTGVVSGVNTLPTGSLLISGIPSQNQTLTLDSSSLADADGLGSFSYQWLANGVAINGATGSSFSLTQAEVGKTITATARYTDGLG